jgi:hypothetical protein
MLKYTEMAEFAPKKWAATHCHTSRLREIGFECSILLKRRTGPRKSRARERWKCRDAFPHAGGRAAS